jgi:hypothetical protein
MNFDPKQTETFETEGSTFEYNHARSEYLAEDILSQYEDQMKNMAKSYKKAKKDYKKTYYGRNILSLHSEWNVQDNDETLYLVFNDDDECFTDVTTDNEYYANPTEEV